MLYYTLLTIVLHAISFASHHQVAAARDFNNKLKTELEQLKHYAQQLQNQLAHEKSHCDFLNQELADAASARLELMRAHGSSDEQHALFQRQAEQAVAAAKTRVEALQLQVAAAEEMRGALARAEGANAKLIIEIEQASQFRVQALEEIRRATARAREL